MPSQSIRTRPCPASLGKRNPIRARAISPRGRLTVEHPSPAEVVRDEATDQRSDDAPQSEDAHDQSHPAAALAGRKDIADGSDAQGHQRASTNAGERSGGDQLAHVLRKTGAG